MSSIRFFLIAVLFSIVGLVMFVAMLIGYQRSLEQAESILDTELNERYELINQLLSHYEKNALKNNNQIHDQFTLESLSLYQIVDEKNKIILQSRNLGNHTLSKLTEGFTNFNYEGRRWHALVKKANELPIWIIIAERDDLRFKLADTIIVDILKPILIALLLLAVAVWLVIRYGFKPVKKLSDVIYKKSASDLSPISMESIPDELKLIASSVNDLFGRINASLDREKRFTADAAHEMRNPITALKIHIDNLLEEIPEKSESLLKIKKAVDRLSNLIEQLLILHRMSPDQYATSFSLINLYDISRDVIQDLYPHIEKKSQSIELKGESTNINGDAFGLEVLLKNIIDNANKYTQNGGKIILTVSNKPVPSITIDDSGPGIPDNEKKYVMDRFYRVGGDRNPSKIIGSGLGMSISKQIVELHGGEILLTDSDQGGLRVKINFLAPFTKESI